MNLIRPASAQSGNDPYTCLTHMQFVVTRLGEWISNSEKLTFMFVDIVFRSSI